MPAVKLKKHDRMRYILYSVLVSSAPFLGTHLASAQSAPPLVSACSGVQLPRSVVTDIMTPVMNGTITPLQNQLNGLTDLLDNIPLIGPLLPPLGINLTTVLNNAAAGQPVTLQVLDLDGNPVDPAGGCGLQAGSIALAEEGGIAIGGNRITGLGANGRDAFAADIDAVAFGNNARTEAGADGSVAIGADSRVTAANSVAIGQGATATRGPQLQYAALAIAGPVDSAGEFSVGAPGGERQITNVAPGSAPTDAVNVAQLQGALDRVDAVETDVAALQSDVATAQSDIAALQDGAVQYDDATHGRVTLAGGPGGTVLDNVADGALAPGSREAVNGGQLYATNQSVANLVTRVDAIDVQITSLANLVASGSGSPGPARYSDAAGIANGGTPTNHATLVGGAPGPVVLHNVGDGAVTAGSTDAVNGGQLAGTNQNVADLSVQVGVNTTDIANVTTQVANNTLAIANLTTLIGTLGGGGVVTPGPVQYSDASGTPNGGVPSNHVTLVGATAGPVGVHNVADGQVVPDSTDAVNGGQLYEVRQEVAETRQVADAAYAMGQNSVQYDGAARDSVTLGNGTTPVALHNVAAGTAPTDAVNVAQLNSSMANAVQTAVDQANAYTDLRLASIGFDLTTTRRDLNGGIAGALAAAGMPQASDPGRSMIAMGVGVYQGQQAVAFGFSSRLNDARTVIRAGASFDTRGRAGGNAGVGIQF